jgi:multidrug efflux pump subunit AcrA (membrane-fusion protein)
MHVRSVWIIVRLMTTVILAGLAGSAIAQAPAGPTSAPAGIRAFTAPSQEAMLSMGMERPGRIAKIPVKEGQVVKAGEVLIQLAATLNKTPADLTTLLFPAGGWDPNAPAGEAVLAQLYLALQVAIQNGALQGSADTLMAGAANKAGIPADTVKGAISYGTSVLPAAGARGPVGGMGPGGFGPASAGAGGGGGVVTQSR